MTCWPVEWLQPRERGLAFWLIQYDRAIEQREWLLNRSEWSSRQLIWGSLTCSNTARHWACLVMVHQRISCCINGLQLEYIGTNFIIKLVVCLKAVLQRALCTTKSAAIPSYSLVTSTWMALINWHLGWGRGVPKLAVVGVSNLHIGQCPKLTFYALTKIPVEMAYRSTVSSASSKTITGLLADERHHRCHSWPIKIVLLVKEEISLQF